MVNQKNYFEQYLNERFQSIIEKLDEQTHMLSSISTDARTTNDRIVILRKDVDSLLFSRDEHSKRLDSIDSFRIKLLTQISMIVAFGSVLMTFIYEYIKQFIHTIFQGR